MRTATLILAALAVLGLASMASAAHVSTTLVAHGGPGYYGGYAGYGPSYAHPHCVHPAPVVVTRPIYGYPRVLPPPVYRVYHYHPWPYHARPGFSYYGNRLGISIGF